MLGLFLNPTYSAIKIRVANPPGVCFFRQPTSFSGEHNRIECGKTLLEQKGAEEWVSVKRMVNSLRRNSVV